MSAGVTNVVEDLERFQNSTYVHVCSAALVAFDWLITLDHEVTYAWNAPWIRGTYLFFLSRYLVFFPTVLSLLYQIEPSFTPSTCGVLFLLVGWMNVAVILIAEFVLTVRVWALWDRRPGIGILLTVVSAIDAVAGVMGFCFYSSSYTFIPINGLPVPLPGCLIVDAGKSPCWSFFALVIHQTFIFLLTAIKCIQHYRTGMYGLGLSLVKTFYIDGFVYYFAMIALSLTNLGVALSKLGVSYTFLLLCLQRAFHSVISARILLHTRHQVAQRRTMKLDSRLVPEILQDLDNTFTNIDEGSRNPATYSMKSPGGSLTEFKLTANWLGKTWRSSKVSSV